MRSEYTYSTGTGYLQQLGAYSGIIIGWMASYSKQLRNGGVFSNKLEDESRGRLHLRRLQAIGT